MHSGWPQTQFLGGGCALCSHFPGNGITATVKHFLNCFEDWRGGSCASTSQS